MGVIKGPTDPKITLTHYQKMIDLEFDRKVPGYFEKKSPDPETRQGTSAGSHSFDACK